MAQVASSASSVTLLGAAAGRRGAVIHNTDANRLDIYLGSAAATAANRHYFANSGDTVELPRDYTGEVRGIWTAAGSGAANTQEW
jgi:deoxycytidine triphosphate deaminase